MQYVAQLQLFKVECKIKFEKGIFIVVIIVKKLKSNYWLTPTKIPQKWGQFYFKVAKGNTITSLKGRMQKIISKRIVMVAIEVKKQKSNN
jgi:hypothetical protein